MQVVFDRSVSARASEQALRVGCERGEIVDGLSGQGLADGTAALDYDDGVQAYPTILTRDEGLQGGLGRA